jgi:hypothetical protein
VLDQIRQLPQGANLAYACNSLEELGAFWDPRLASIDAHTGHRIVPMCFQADVFGALNGVQISPEVISPYFRLAPQRVIYPDASARPSPEAVATFMRANGIAYIYADAAHPNNLIPAAVEIVSSGDIHVLRMP